MLQATTIARPYATAIFKIAKQHKTSSIWQKALQDLSTLVNAEDIRKLIGNPKINQLNLILELRKFLTDYPPSFIELDKLLELLLHNKRLLILPAISQYFDKLLNEYAGNSNVLIESAFKMNAEQKKAFVKYLENKFGKKLHASIKIVPELIGGIRAFIGDEVFDYSVKSQLEKMKANIITG